jgi:hypothetical protein
MTDVLDGVRDHYRASGRLRASISASRARGETAVAGAGATRVYLRGRHRFRLKDNVRGRSPDGCGERPIATQGLAKEGRLHAAQVEESTIPSPPMLADMPASPHQIAVLRTWR